MEQHDVFITIGKSGEVQVETRGVKGKGCLAYGKLLADTVGRVKDQRFTSEYYEPDSRVAVNLESRQRRG